MFCAACVKFFRLALVSFSPRVFKPQSGLTQTFSFLTLAKMRCRACSISSTVGMRGENSAVIRKMIMERLSFMNITIDNEKNEEQDGATVISGEDSAITMMKIPTNEELMIARDVMELKNKKNKC